MTRRLLRGAGKWLGFITITVVTVFLGLFRTGHNAQDVAVIETSWQRSSSATFVATEPDGPSHLAQIEDELDHLLAQAHRVLDETSDILEERTWIGEPAGGVPDGGEPYDGNIASTTDLEPYPQVYFGPRKLLLICLFTGGTQFSKGDVKRVAGRVNAQMSSWAGKSEADVYYVTHMDVNTTYNAKRIWLPDLAEDGGYRSIWRKSLLLFDYLAKSELGQQYDFVYKGDDDTLLNVPQILRVLSAFNPEIPLSLGNNMYGVSAKGPAPTSVFFRQNRGCEPCHGGAGYVLSRALLQLVGPHFPGCMDEWPQTTYEDAKVAFCLMRHAASHCIGMKPHFGWDRYHNVKREQVPAKLANLEHTPLRYAMGVSFHPVPEPYQASLYRRLGELDSKLHDEMIKSTEETLATSYSYLVAQWNCTLKGSAPSASPVNALCQQYSLKKPPLHYKSRELNQVYGRHPVPPRRWMPADKPLPVSGAGAAIDAVIVVLDPELDASQGPVRERSLMLLVRSLRATGSMAHVLLFPAAASASNEATKAAVAAAAGDPLGLVRIFQAPQPPVTPLDASKYGSGFAVAAGTIADFLREHRAKYNRILMVSPNALFQLDPFVHIPSRGGVMLFITDTFDSNLTLHKIDPALSTGVMGVCTSRDVRISRLKTPSGGYFRGPGVLDTSVVIGTAASVEAVLLEVVYNYRNSLMGPACSPAQVLSRSVWKSTIAERCPVTVPLQSFSPAINLAAIDKGLWTIANGVVKNRKGFTAPIVLAPGQCLCCTQVESEEGDYAAELHPRLCPTAALPSDLSHLARARTDNDKQ